MRHWNIIRAPEAMATPWRRRTTCRLIDRDRTLAAVLVDIDGRGARLEATNPPPIGAEVELHHPEAGAISAKVQAIHANGLRIAFDRNEAAIAFALATIAADMTKN